MVDLHSLRLRAAPKDVTMTIRLDVLTHEQLINYCETYGLRPSAVVREVVEQFLRQVEASEDE